MGDSGITHQAGGEGEVKPERVTNGVHRLPVEFAETKKQAEAHTPVTRRRAPPAETCERFERWFGCQEARRSPDFHAPAEGDGPEKLLRRADAQHGEVLRLVGACAEEAPKRSAA